jgi:hypothetical protein
MRTSPDLSVGKVGSAANDPLGEPGRIWSNPTGRDTSVNVTGNCPSLAGRATSPREAAAAPAAPAAAAAAPKAAASATAAAVSTAAAASETAASAAASAAMSAATSAAMSAAASVCKLQPADRFLVKEMERRQADVGNFLVTESEGLKWCRILRRYFYRRYIRQRSTGCRRQGRPGDSQHGCGFAWTLHLKSTLRLRHSRVPPLYLTEPMRH